MTTVIPTWTSSTDTPPTPLARFATPDMQEIADELLAGGFAYEGRTPDGVHAFVWPPTGAYVRMDPHKPRWKKYVREQAAKASSRRRTDRTRTKKRRVVEQYGYDPKTLTEIERREHLAEVGRQRRRLEGELAEVVEALSHMLGSEERARRPEVRRRITLRIQQLQGQHRRIQHALASLDA